MTSNEKLSGTSVIDSPADRRASRIARRLPAACSGTRSWAPCANAIRPPIASTRARSCCDMSAGAGQRVLHPGSPFTRSTGREPVQPHGRADAPDHTRVAATQRAAHDRRRLSFVELEPREPRRLHGGLQSPVRRCAASPESTRRGADGACQPRRSPRAARPRTRGSSPACQSAALRQAPALAAEGSYQPTTPDRPGHRGCRSGLQTTSAAASPLPPTKTLSRANTRCSGSEAGDSSRRSPRATSAVALEDRAHRHSAAVIAGSPCAAASPPA